MQENVTHSRSWSTETNIEMKEMMELADTSITAIVHMLKLLRKKHQHKRREVENILQN